MRFVWAMLLGLAGGFVVGEEEPKVCLFGQRRMMSRREAVLCRRCVSWPFSSAERHAGWERMEVERVA